MTAPGCWRLAAGSSLLATCVAILLVADAPTSARQQDASAQAKQAYTRAAALEDEGNYPAALTLLWEAAGVAARGAAIQNRIGDALERVGVLDGAVRAYRVAVQEKPDFRKASNNLILALVKVGKGEEAVQRARALVALDPNVHDRYVP